MAVSSCQKQIDKPDQSQAEETATRKSGLKNPPVANAGNDITTILPVNSVILNGSAYDADNNNIASYLWTKISGPSSFSIANANALQTQVTNLVVGVYQFELKVTDKTRLVDRDTVQVTVYAQSTQSPPCTSCKIVFVSNRDGNDEIYSCNADGSNVTRLTNDPAADGKPVWSPDGTKIAFTSDRNTGYPELYIMNADGSNVVRKTFSGCHNPTWSPDGINLAYSSDNYLNIWVVNTVSGLESPLYYGSEGNYEPAWSPDGVKIAFVNDLWGYDIYMINSDGTGLAALTRNGNYRQLCWSPNGTKLSVVINNYSVGVMNRDGSGITVITYGGVAPETRTSWSGDGTTIAYTLLNGSSKDVSWVSADGSATGIIITNGWDADWRH